MHQPAQGVFFQNVALQNDPQPKGLDQPENAGAEDNGEQTFEGLQNSLPGGETAGIRADFYHKPADDPVYRPQDANGQCQV